MITLLGRALESLRVECEQEGKADFFEKVKPWLTGDAEHGDQLTVANEAGISPAALKMAIHHLKRRFRKAVKAEVAATLEDMSMGESEMECLFAALGG